MAKQLLVGPGGQMIFENPGDLMAGESETTTVPITPCTSESLEFTVTGITAGNRDGTDGGGDYINWMGEKWYNNVSQPHCPTTSYLDRDTCSKAYGATNTLYYPAKQLWLKVGGGGSFRLHAQTGGTVDCRSASPCFPILVPVGGGLQHTGVAGFTFQRQLTVYKATCAPPGFNTPNAFAPLYISNNISTTTSMYWFGSAQIPRPMTGTVTSTQGITISWQEYAGW